MRKFETISEREILSAAFFSIAKSWSIIYEEKQELIKRGMEKCCELQDYWLKKYKEQMDELLEAIREMEHQQNAE